MAGADIPSDSFPLARINEFFNKRQEGPWMRWLYDVGNLRDGTVYLDDLDNLEIYGSYNYYQKISPYLDKYANGKNGTFVTVQYEQPMFGDLLDKRRCVYQLKMHPTADELSAMYDSMNVDCEVINSAIRADDLFGGVNVSIVEIGPNASDVKRFLAYQPNSDSAWMAWGEYKGQYIYHDSDDNAEVYSEDGRLVPGLPPSDYHIYVRIPSRIEPLWLRVARAQLYKKTNDLYATQEQLDDMVELIARNPPSNKDLKKWGESLYKQGPNVDKTTWTFEPPRGSLPQKAQFYFNPKPLKKGDQSEYDNGTRNDNTTLKEMVGEGNWDKGWA